MIQQTIPSRPQKNIPLFLIQKLALTYSEMFGVNPLLPTRRQLVVVPRQCLGYILTNKYAQGSSHLGRMFGCNHATILHGNKAVHNALSVLDRMYVESLNNWRFVFDKHKEFVQESTDTVAMLKRRIVEVIMDGISDGVISADDLDSLLIDLLATDYNEGVLEEI